MHTAIKITLSFHFGVGSCFHLLIIVVITVIYIFRHDCLRKNNQYLSPLVALDRLLNCSMVVKSRKETQADILKLTFIKLTLLRNVQGFFVRVRRVPGNTRAVVLISVALQYLISIYNIVYGAVN